MKFSIGSNMQATQSQNWIQRKSNEYSTCIQKKSNIARILLQYCIQIGFTLIPTWKTILPQYFQICDSNIGAILYSNIAPMLCPILGQYWGNIGVLSGMKAGVFWLCSECIPLHKYSSLIHTLKISNCGEKAWGFGLGGWVVVSCESYWFFSGGVIDVFYR